MNADILTFVFGGFALFFVYFFFFMKKEKVYVAEKSVGILVSGGYKPSKIEVKKGEPVKFNFTRTDSSECLEEVVLPDFKIKKYLPLNQKVEVEINPNKKGEYFFSCGMNMNHGKIIVS